MDPDAEVPRVPTASEFLKQLDAVEDELTDPDGRGVVDPAEARRGDRLEGGFEVERVLGRGSSGIALLARRGEDEFVLKVAREAEDNARLRQEAEAIRNLRSEFTVGMHDGPERRGRG